ncbi:carbohydrate-binding protein [Paenibacillus sp. 7124]|uniref:Carbohydrate-binding protein n=1 Tax=Paenibacillus apii TaxID=1850370 RepID=A0A6M1PHV0_9BACL|nr:glycoside hydrolase family 66 protein [Paenibacillus apii]NGM82756.1 carbohydrate-binding protein [Paenibacillus apii]
MKGKVSAMKFLGKRMMAVTVMMALILSAASAAISQVKVFAFLAGSVITELSTDLPRYNPGQTVTITAKLTNDTGGSLSNATVTLYYKHLEQEVGTEAQTFSLGSGATGTLTFSWQPPSTDYQGYLIEAWVRDSSGNILDNLNTAADVSSSWTKFPRYGYLSVFNSQSSAASSDTIQKLAKYHINALQFYDWHWEHHIPLSGTVSNPSPTWNDVANRTIYKQTLTDYISFAHSSNMSAMAYNLLYGAFDGYDTDGSGVQPSWGIYTDTNHTTQWGFPLPGGWATSKIHFMNPANTSWQNYIISRQKDVFNAFAFDGWHVDQVGEFPDTSKYDYNGNPINQSSGFASLLNNAKSQMPNKTIIFNNVNTYGYADTANANVDLMYTELWDDRDLSNIKDVLDTQTSLSGKASVFPLYMNYNYQEQFQDLNPGHFNTPAVLLADAGIFAMGAQHLELGDNLNMLDHEYFPNKHLIMYDELKKKLLALYDFAVAYENLLRDGLANTNNRVELPGIASSTRSDANKVWTFTKAGKGYEVIQMINQLGITDTAVRDKDATKPAPSPQTNVTVKYYYTNGPVGQVNYASPDYDNGKTYQLPFTAGSDGYGNYVQFTVPTLQYWDMIYITPKPNLLLNGGFESGDLTGWTEWHPSGQAAAYGIDGSDVHEGGKKLYFWYVNAYQQSVHQIKTGLSNGSYTVTAWVKATANGSQPSAARLEVNGAYTNFTVDGIWRQYTADVTVSGGQVDAGFYVNSPGSTSIQIDDVKLVKN